MTGALDHLGPSCAVSQPNVPLRWTDYLVSPERLHPDEPGHSRFNAFRAPDDTRHASAGRSGRADLGAIIELS